MYMTTVRSDPKPSVVRARDLGVSPSALAKLLEKGLLERPGRGVYGTTSGMTERRTLVEAAVRVPHGVVCLLSALDIHGLGSQAPYGVWMAIDVKARKPRADWLPLRIVRFSGAARHFGVETMRFEGVDVRVTSAEKTVVDCFKYRTRQVGLDVAIEALRDYLSRSKRSVGALMEAARVCRMHNVMRPYIEALVA